ncbi:ABC transporter permease [Streptomyces sp. NPDC051219]|uniref:ABC transporter permease n=1 Tax=Streptomyces sp. NPDC051219 TaxID=3155283 RepID=UPI0034238CE6
MRTPFGASAAHVPAVAPWVRTRLRFAPGTSVALAVLVLVTSFLAAAFPRGVHAYESRGLLHTIESASPARSAVDITSTPAGLEVPQRHRAAALTPPVLEQQYDRALKLLPEPVRADTTQSAYGARSPVPLHASDRWLPRPEGLFARFLLTTQSDVAGHARVATGRLPRADADRVNADTAQVEAAVSTATAGTLGIRVGASIHLRGETGRALTVRITGLVEPVAPEGPYWSVQPLLRNPSLTPESGRPPQHYWAAALLLAPEAGPALLRVSRSPEGYVQIAPRTAHLTASDATGLADAVASLESGPHLTELRGAVGRTTAVTSDLEQLVAAFEGMRGAISPVVAVAVFGIGTVAGVVLLMAGGLSAARRHAELSLIRSRGGSVRGIVGRLLAETAVVAVPAAALGGLAAVLLLPHGAGLASLSAAAGVAVVACAALPLRAAFVHRRPRLHGGREDLVRARPSRRRTVAELTLLVLAVGAVAALRRRGTGGEVDQLVSAAPVLVGVIGALLLVRLHPLPLRLAARASVRRRGAVGFLSLARAGRSPATAALPLLALLVALTTAAFGCSVLAGVADARDRAALLAVGADARIESAGELPRSLASAVRGVRGVEEATAVTLDYSLALPDGKQSVVLVAVEPAAYARLAAKTGLGAFPASELRRTGGSGTGGSAPLPAIASPAVAQRLGAQPQKLYSTVLSEEFTVAVAAVRTGTPAAPGADYLLVNAAGLSADRPMSLLVTGSHIDTGGLKTAAREAGANFGVQLLAEERTRFADSAVQTGAERMYGVAVAAGAGYAVLAVLLSLLQAAPERTAVLARLRTMGLTRREGRRLLVLESLPQALPAALGGALVGWAAIRLLAPGVDLGVLALSAQARVAGVGDIQLRTDPWSLLVPAMVIVLIAAAVGVVQAWWATRRATTIELRAGDQR